MQFHDFGKTTGKTVMVMHGMICDWQKFREIFKPLEEGYHFRDS